MRFLFFTSIASVIIISGLIIFLDCTISIDNKYSSYGSLLSGIGTVLAVVLAFIKVPDELEKWKTREVAKKRMSVAAEVIEAVDNLLDSIYYLTNQFSDSHEVKSENNSSEDYDHFTELMNARMSIIKEDLNRFFKSKKLARIYLNKSVYLQLEDISKVWKKLSIDMQMYATRPKDNIKMPIAIRESYDSFYDTKGKRKQKLSDIHETIEKLIKKDFLYLKE